MLHITRNDKRLRQRAAARRELARLTQAYDQHAQHMQRKPRDHSEPGTYTPARNHDSEHKRD